MCKVLIRPLKISDAQISWKWRNDPKIWEFTGSKPKEEITYEIENDWIQKAIDDQTTKRFAILVDDVYVGNIQLTDIIEYDTAQYHVFIGDRNYWGKGVAKLATHQILYYAKAVLGLKNIFLNVRKENFSAIKVYKQNGFKIVNEKENWIKMNCDISGNYNLGDYAYLGNNSSIEEKLSIHSLTTIGMNGAVVKHIEGHGTYVGVPIKKIK
jgi:RimJ/RimL family protein N-acetyltransferase